MYFTASEADIGARAQIKTSCKTKAKILKYHFDILNDYATFAISMPTFKQTYIAFGILILFTTLLIFKRCT